MELYELLKYIDNNLNRDIHLARKNDIKDLYIGKTQDVPYKYINQKVINIVPFFDERLHPYIKIFITED